jgi:3-deoxy-7-phosphoheptulonate synthase
MGDRLVLVMRTYFEKPRTALGWKGLLADPHLDGSCDVTAGLALARRLLVAINDMGVPCAAELLSPAVAPYLAGLISWGCIGARTAEGAAHRQLASGLTMPVGFKNGTDGRVETAVNAVLAARQGHTALEVGQRGRVAALTTPGNRDAHVVLRGGGGATNFGREHVERAWSLLGRPNGRPVLIDCSHDNSGKDPARQGPVCRAVLEQIVAGQKGILGVALESNLRPGKQAPGPLSTLTYGVSVTDPCIGWEETRRLLGEMAEAVARLASR